MYTKLLSFVYDKFCSALYLENLLRNILNLRGGVSCMPAALLFLPMQIVGFPTRRLKSSIPWFLMNYYKTT